MSTWHRLSSLHHSYPHIASYSSHLALQSPTRSTPQHSTLWRVIHCLPQSINCVIMQKWPAWYNLFLILPVVLVAYNAHYSSKYLQAFTLHRISTNCSSINKGTIPEVLANIVFIFLTSPSFLVRNRSSIVSRLAQTVLLSQFKQRYLCSSVSPMQCAYLPDLWG